MITIATELFGCGPTFSAGSIAGSIAGSVAGLLNGSDDRVEVFEHASAEIRALAASVVALVPIDRIDDRDPTDVRLLGPTLKDRAQLCDSEPFAEQVAASTCSGVLIDRDLVLTAAHCIKDQSYCSRGMRVVLGFQLGRTVIEDEVFACETLLLRTRASGLDYAVLRLDRPVPHASEVFFGDPVAGEKLISIGHPEGVPAKIDDGAVVLQTYTSSFTATTDTFGGSSGGGGFSSDHHLLGIFSGGASDYVFQDGCFSRTVQEGASAESFTRTAPIATALCALGWPSETCGARSSCGDGECALDESSEGCPVDCPNSRCGDERCSADELDSCPDDCGVTLGQTPPGWRCKPAFYGSDDGCDIDCGAEDPDCAGPAGCSALHTPKQAPSCARVLLVLLCLLFLRKRGFGLENTG